MLDYVFSSNTITFYENNCKDFYLCDVKDSRGNKAGTFGIKNESRLQECIEEAHKHGFEPDFIKLNDKEKEAYTKGLTAHELRHCIQMHLLASTKGCSRTFKKLIEDTFQNKMNSYRKALKELQKINSEARKLGLPEEEITIKPPEYSVIEYSDNFIPAKFMEEDVKLKFSLSPKDARYLSTKDHMLRYLQDIADKQSSVDSYLASPIEMDANNYAYQYFCTKIKKNPEFSSIRKPVADSIENYFFDKARDGKIAMKNYGYPDLISK